MRRFPSSGPIISSPSYSRLIVNPAPWRDPFLLQANRSASICLQCQWRLFTLSNDSKGKVPPRQRQHPHRRSQAPLLTQSWRLSLARYSSSTNQNASILDAAKAKPDKPDKENELPSEREARRRPILKKIFRYLDRAQEDLAEVTQRFNKATGMDYSGITALRAKIQDQEKQIQYHHATILKAKNAVEAADTQRAAAQKEVVGLLERKHSWTSGDLERYMSLIRSEHVNDQAVSESKEKLRAAETALELARSKMEQMVASQYHEETLLNDTIRRNSTWVTVGLMGFNVFLLLASLVIIEPWRRKRLVREIRTAFDEQNLLAQPHLAAATSITAETPQITDSAAVTDGALGSSSIPPVTPLTAFTEEPVDTEETNPHNHLDRLNHWMSIVRDRFSDRQVTMKQLDITSIALQGASAGAAVAIGLMILLNPR